MTLTNPEVGLFLSLLSFNGYSETLLISTFLASLKRHISPLDLDSEFIFGQVTLAQISEKSGMCGCSDLRSRVSGEHGVHHIEIKPVFAMAS
jgi:hypothetical protein